MNGRLRFSVHTNYGSLPSERARVRLVRYVVPPEDEGTRETKPAKRIGKVAVFFYPRPRSPLLNWLPGTSHALHETRRRMIERAIEQREMRREGRRNNTRNTRRT